VIRIEVAIDKYRCISRLSSTGHSHHSISGINIACAAASALIRTFARTLFLDSDITINGGTEQEGSLILRRIRAPVAKRDWLCGVSDFFIRGLRDLASEFPGDVVLEILEEE
jgi:uncharacterized protein YsxB (DUF464 family)